MLPTALDELPQRTDPARLVSTVWMDWTEMSPPSGRKGLKLMTHLFCGSAASQRLSGSIDRCGCDSNSVGGIYDFDRTVIGCRYCLIPIRVMNPGGVAAGLVPVSGS